MKRVRRKYFLEKLPPNTKLVARPSRWGNPYSLKDHSLKDSLVLYRQWLDYQMMKNPLFIEPLRDFDLACYCRTDQACHADILLEYLREKPEEKKDAGSG